jgi:TolA-binding protein
MHKVPSQQPRPSEQLAHTMQQESPELDDFARARMERNLVDAWRARGARAVELPKRRAVPTWALQVSVMLVVGVVGVAAGMMVLRMQEAALPATVPGVVAHFELVMDDGAVQSGYLSEGQVLDSGSRGRVEVSLAQSRVDIAPDTRVRFDRLAGDDVRLSLVKGRVDVAFHPQHKGRERLAVETRAASVLVVGTRFEVVADASGDTHVSVSEGVVQVSPRRGGAPTFVRAGEQLDVRVQDAAEIDRAAREAIADRIAAEPEVLVVDLDDVTSAERSAQPTVAEQSPEKRLEGARALLMQGKHTAARERLQRLAKGTLPTGTRVEAQTLIAESFTAQGQIPQATEAYREAARIAPHHPAGHNALFALARLIERYTEDKSSAGATYREYLRKAPKGALAPQAREALCRLGDAASCQ